MGRIDEAVAVLVDQEGAPTLFRWREKDYQVSSKPVRWFARNEWWAGERAHRGIGSGAVEVEMWRLLANHDDQYLYVEILLAHSTSTWKLSKIWAP